MAKSANDGMMDYWVFQKEPLFQYSNIPASFRENTGAGIAATYQARFILGPIDVICILKDHDAL